MMLSTRTLRRSPLANPEGARAGTTVGQTDAVRRVVLELRRQDPEDLECLPGLGVIESFRVVHLFRLDSKGYSGICRVKFRDPAVRPAKMVGHLGISKVGHLAQLADGAYLANIEGRTTAGWTRLAALSEGASEPALELTPESWRIVAVGSRGQIRGLLADLRRFHLRYRVLSIEDTNLKESSPRSPAEILTPKQRQALVAAYACGYYDIPRRVDTADVARTLARGKSTTLEHLRKAEKRLLDSYMAVGGRLGRV